MARTKAQYRVIMVDEYGTKDGEDFISYRSTGPLHKDRPAAREWINTNCTAGAAYGIICEPKVAMLVEKPATRSISI